MEPYSRNSFQFVTYRINDRMTGLKVQGTHNGYWEWPSTVIIPGHNLPRTIQSEKIVDIEYIKDLLADLSKVIPQMKMAPATLDNTKNPRFPSKWYMVWKLRGTSEFRVEVDEDDSFLYREGFNRDRESLRFEFELAMLDSTVDALNLLQLFTIIRA